MPKSKVNYSEGDIITIPLKDDSGRNARGVIARMNGKGGVFGFFFPPSENLVEGLHPSGAILVGLFGDLGLIKNKWKVVGKIDPWNRDEWELLPFLSINKPENFAYLREYDPDTLKLKRETKYALEEINPNDYHQDGDMGAGFVEGKLTDIINQKQNL